MKFYSIITLSIFIFLSLTFQCSAQYGLRVDGQVYLKNKKKPLKGMVGINRKSDKVTIYTEDKVKKDVLVEGIDSLKTKDNQLYIVKNLEGSPTLFEVNLSGHISLLHLRNKGAYFFLKEDTLYQLNEKKLRGVLNAYFPDFSYSKKMLDPNYKEVRYDDSFLEPFINTYNHEKYPTEKISEYKTNYKKFKISISPYLAVSTNTAQVTFRNKIFSYGSPTQPNYGISLAIVGDSKLVFGADLYQIKFEGSLPLLPKQPDVPDEFIGVNISYFSFNNLLLDAKVQYNFKKDVNQKLNPFLFIGPSIGFPLTKRIQISRTRVGIQDSSNYYTQIEQDLLQDRISNFLYAGVNAGCGIEYSVSKKYALRLQAKYQIIKAYIANDALTTSYGGLDFDNKSVSVGLSLVRNL